MRWTGRTGNAPVAARSPRQQAPSPDDVKVFHGEGSRLQSLWYHDIDAEVPCAQLLLQAQGDTLYVCIMCLVTNFLSSIALDVGSRSTFGQTSAALFFLRRSYNLRITVSATNIVSGLIATIFLAIGEKSGLPHLYLPWLVNTMRGMAFCEGPALMGITYVLIPNADLPASFFLFITLLLYVEELCLWNDVFRNFQSCWIIYDRRRKTKNELKDESKQSEQEASAFPVKHKPFVLRTKSVKSSRMSGEPYSIASDMPELGMTLFPSSPSVSEEFPKARTTTRRLRRPSDRARCINMTG